MAKFWKVNIWRTAREACSATWNLGTYSAFALGPRKTTENLDRVSGHALNVEGKEHVYTRYAEITAGELRSKQRLSASLHCDCAH
jgi:hypothetical protein